MMKHSFKPRILCIEDEKDFRENIVEILSHESFDVLQAENGRDGIEQFESSRPDIVLCDIQMPEMNGFDMLNQLKQKYPSLMHDTSFLFLSALNDKSNMLSGFHMGCDDYIVKPIDYDLLLAKLNQLSEQHKGRLVKTEQLRSLIHFLLPSIMKLRLQRPLNALLGYSELFESTDPSCISHYVERIQSVTNEQLALQQTIALILQLASNRYEYNASTTALNSFLWEALTIALGYDVAYESILEDMTDAVIIDTHIYHCLISTMIRNLHQYHHRVPVFQKHSDAEYVHVIVKPKQMKLSDQPVWHTPQALLDDPSNPSQSIQFFGLELLLAAAINVFNASAVPIQFSKQTDSMMAMKLVFPNVRHPVLN